MISHDATRRCFVSCLYSLSGATIWDADSVSIYRDRLMTVARGGRYLTGVKVAQNDVSVLVRCMSSGCSD
jgi:hypothetical protein